MTDRYEHGGVIPKGPTSAKIEKDERVAVSGGQIIEHHPRRPPPELHYCRQPGRWQRRKHNIGYDTVWQCDTCGSRWRWRTGHGDFDHWWQRV